MYQPAWLLAGADPPPAVCYPLAFQGQTTLLASPPGVGKSQLLIALALAAAEGRDLFSTRKVRSPREVLYLGLDSNWVDYANSFESQATGLGLTSPLTSSTTNPYLESLNDLPICFTFHSPALEADGLEKLANNAPISPDLIIIDVLRRAHNLQENDDQHMSMLMDRLSRLARDAKGKNFGRAVVFAHHTAKAALDGRPGVYGSRGSSVIVGSADIVAEIYRKRLVGDTHKLLKLYFHKGRGRSFPESLLYSMQWERDRPWMVLELADEHDPANATDPVGILKSVISAGGSYTWQQLLSLTHLDTKSLAKARDALGLVKDNGKWRLPASEDGGQS